MGLMQKFSSATTESRGDLKAANGAYYAERSLKRTLGIDALYKANLRNKGLVNALKSRRKAILIRWWTGSKEWASNVRLKRTKEPLDRLTWHYAS